MTTFLKFPDRPACLAAFAPFAPDPETPMPQLLPDGRAVCDVGVVYKDTGQTLTDDDGHSYPERLPLAGYHINISGNDALPAELAAFVIPDPATPSCDFYAGGL